VVTCDRDYVRFQTYLIGQSRINLFQNPDLTLKDAILTDIVLPFNMQKEKVMICIALF